MTTPNVEEVQEKYLRGKLRKEIERRKKAGGMQAGLPSVKVDLYALERILDRYDEAIALLEQHRWRDVREELPGIGERVWCFAPPGRYFADTRNEVLSASVTHWKPLVGPGSALPPSTWPAE
jgi:hypothetical protein